MNLSQSALIALSLSVCSSQASLVLLDNMNYGATDITGGASITAGDWNIPSNRVAYLSGTNLTFSGDADYVNDSANAGTGSMGRNAGSLERAANRDFTDATITGEVWMSSLIGLTSPTANWAGISLNDTATAGGTTFTADVLGVGYDGSALVPMWFDDSAATVNLSASNTLAANSTVLLLAKLNIVNGGADSFSLWVFDSTDSFGTTEASLGTAHLTSTSADFGNSLDKIQLGGNPFQSNFDQIRISNSSGDMGLQQVLVIPEPSTALSGLMLAAGILLRRRRG